MRRALPGFAEGAVTRQLRRFFFVRLLLLVERHQTYVGRTLASEHGPRHEVLAQFALPLRKGVRALPVERELVVLGVMHGLAGIAEAVRDRRAVRLLMWEAPPMHANVGPQPAQNVGLSDRGRSRRHVPRVRPVVDMFLPDA